MSKICLNCGNEVEDTAHFCNICGTEMNEQTCASNTPPEPEPALPTEQICPSCGKTLLIDSKFCRYCGTALQKSRRNRRSLSRQTHTTNSRRPQAAVLLNRRIPHKHRPIQAKILYRQQSLTASTGRQSAVCSVRSLRSSF